jgi:hypothetical protein
MGRQAAVIDAPQEHDGPVAGEPTGASTLLEALERLRAAGFAGDMFVTAEATVRCGSCHEETAPTELDLECLVRLEGVSDPADEAAVLALTCRACGGRGTAVVRYGPEAEPQDDVVLRAVEDHRP